MVSFLGVAVCPWGDAPSPPRRCPLLRTQPRIILRLLPPLPLGEGWGEGVFWGGFSPCRVGQLTQDAMACFGVLFGKEGLVTPKEFCIDCISENTPSFKS